MTRSFSSRWVAPLCFAGVCAALFTSAPPARAQGTRAEASEEFKALMRKGIVEYRNGNFEDARQALTRAWTLRQENELAATLAEVEMKVGRFREAADHWEFYIDTLPPDRTEAEQRLIECRRRLGSVRVAAEPEGAAVFVDGKEIGRAPLRSDVWLEPGDHTVELRLQGRVSPMKRVSVAAGDALGVALVVDGSTAPGSGGTGASVGAAGAAAGAPPPEVDAGGGGGLSTSSIVLIAGSVLTATATGLGIGFTLKAGGAEDDVTALREKIAKEPGSSGHAYCNPPAGTAVPTDCRDLVSKLDERDSARRIALGSFIGAGVLGVGTVVTFLAWPSDKKTGSSGGPRVAVLPFDEGPGASLRVRF